MVKQPVRVLFCCTGVGIFNRGIETFFREAFDGLKSAEGIEARLVKGARGGEHGAGSALATANSASDNPKSAIDASLTERVVWCLPRTGKLGTLIGRLTGRSAYAVEQWSSFPGVVREIRRFRPNVVFTSEANLMFLLRRFRRQIGVPIRLLYSNGGPVHPPFDRHDCVHQVAPFYLDEAIAAGEPASRHVFVPYGIHVPASPFATGEEKQRIRARLGLPFDRPIVLSVGWVARQHKRMHHLIEEVALLPEPRPFVQLLGTMDHESAEIVELGGRLLGSANFNAHSVSYEQVGDFYQAADLFALCSLKEGFGRVYLEALMHGLPTIGHNHPVIKWVLGDVGLTTDLSTPGNLSAVLNKLLNLPDSDAHRNAKQRRESVRNRFSWEVLSPQYVDMFRHCVGGTRPPVRGSTD